MKCLINEQQCFLGCKITCRRQVILDPIKKRVGSLLNDFKDILGEACVGGVHNNDAFVNVGN